MGYRLFSRKDTQWISANGSVYMVCSGLFGWSFARLERR
nr:MAG TPA: hypothetical protein [Caudoviricetes sp.]